MDSILIALLHDIGKVYRYYPELWEGFPQVKKHRHAYFGKLLLLQLGFREEVAELVRYTHGEIPEEYKEKYEEIISVVRRSDRIDSSFRGSERAPTSDPVSILGLKPEKAISLHGGDPLETIKNGLRTLKGEKNIVERIVAIMKEATALLTSDPQAGQDISLFVHAMATASIASCLQRGYKPVLAHVEVNAEERSQFATIERAEYLSGLQLYSYFGLLAAASKALYLMGLQPYIHIISATPLHLALVIPQESCGVLEESLNLLCSDLGCKASLRVRAIEDGDFRRIYEKEIIPPLRRASLPLSDRRTCRYCGEGVQQTHSIETTDGILCASCFFICHAPKFFIGATKTFSIVLGCDGLITYKNLEASVVNERREGALLRGILNPKSSEEVCESGLIPFDIFVGPLIKDYETWLLISCKKVLLSALAGKSPLHRFSTAVLLLPHLLYKEMRKSIKNCEPIKFDPTSLILQIREKHEAVRAALRCLHRGDIGMSSILIKRGHPGITFRKLMQESRKIEDKEVLLLKDEGVEILRESLRDARAFIQDLQQFIEGAANLVPKVAIRSLEILPEIYAAEESIDRILVKSKLLLSFVVTARDEGLPLISQRPKEKLSAYIAEKIEKLPIIFSTIATLYKYKCVEDALNADHK